MRDERLQVTELQVTGAEEREKNLGGMMGRRTERLEEASVFSEKFRRDFFDKT